MEKFYLTIIDAVSLYGSNSWTRTSQNSIRLRNFHNRAVRYMTSKQYCKVGKHEWKYSNHEKLFRKFRLISIETYIKQSRGKLQNYLEENREKILKEVGTTTAPARNLHKIY